jgi:hypothetical protein
LIIDFWKVTRFCPFVLLVTARFVIQLVFLYSSSCKLLSYRKGKRANSGNVLYRNTVSEVLDNAIEEYFHFKDEKQSVLFEGPRDTAQSTVCISITKVKQFILHGKRVAAWSEIKYTTHQDNLWAESRSFKF